jgi:hypothetical protein
MDEDACNFSPGAEEAGKCIFLSDVADMLNAASEDDVDCDGCLVATDCAGMCGGSATTDECGVCAGDGLACARCSDSTACNFFPDHAQAANVDDAACTYPLDNYDCFGACNVGFDCVGVCAGSTIYDECGVCGGNATCCVSRPSEPNATNAMEAIPTESPAVRRRRLNFQDWKEDPPPDDRVQPSPDTTTVPASMVTQLWVAPSPDVTLEPVDGVTDEAPNVAPAPDLQDGDNGQVMPAPQSSCEGNCLYLAGLKNATCFCDDLCVAYEDCCADKEEFCPFDYGLPIPSPKNTGDIPAPDGTDAKSPEPAPDDFVDLLPAPDPTSTTSLPLFAPVPAPLNFGNAKGSCVGFCLKVYGSHGKICHCDKMCVYYNDCCSDFKKECKGVTTTTTTTTTTIAPDSCEKTGCGGSSGDGSCWCDELCRLNDDCCSDFAVFCGACSPWCCQRIVEMGWGACMLSEGRVNCVVYPCTRAKFVVCVVVAWLITGFRHLGHPGLPPPFTPKRRCR